MSPRSASASSSSSPTSPARTCSWPTTATGSRTSPLPHMIQAFRAAGKLAAVRGRPPALPAHIVEADERAAGCRASDDTRRACASTAASSCMRPRSSTRSTRGGAGRGALPAAVPRSGSACTSTTASWARWTRSRTASGSKGSSESGPRPVARATASRATARGRLMRELEPARGPSRSARPRPRRALRRHRDRLRRDAPPPCAARPGLESFGSFSPPRAPGPTRRGRPRRRSWRLRGEASVEVHPFRDGFLPYDAAAVKDEFEALKTRFPDIVFTHTGTTAIRTTGSSPT